jgi:hypothetical protein
MDKAIIYTVIIIILAGVLFWAIQSGFLTSIFSSPANATPLPSGIVLFYGQECPHCADVDAFIKANNIDQKVKITKLEVWHDRNNATLLAEVAQKCGISSGSVGVPFLYDPPSAKAGENGKCYIGEVDVPNFLKIQAGIK